MPSPLGKGKPSGHFFEGLGMIDDESFIPGIADLLVRFLETSKPAGEEEADEDVRSCRDSYFARINPTISFTEFMIGAAMTRARAEPSASTASM